MSTGGIQELVIPLRFDSADAARDLAKVAAAGKHAGEETAEGMDKATHGAKSLGSEIGTLIKAQIGFGAMKSVIGGIGDEMRRVAEEVGRTSREFQQFRESLQGTASLSGRENTNKFAEEEIARAERAHVTPQQMQQFRDKFLAKASLYVGNGPAAKMSTADADKFQEYLSEYAASKGVGQADMADFAGGLLAQQKGKTNFSEMKARAGRSFATLEASSADVKHLMPAMTRVMAQGFSAEEASRTLAAMPEIAPEEEGTHLLRVMAEVRRLNIEGKAGKFGIKDGMSNQQQLEALVGNLRERSGGDQKRLDVLLRDVTHEDIAANTLRGMVNQVNFDQWQQVQGEIKDDALDETIAASRKTEAGRQRAVTSAHAVESARMGLRNDAVDRRRQIAEVELMKGGAFERADSWAEYAAAQLPGADDVKGIKINQQAIRRARAELGESSGIGDARVAINRGSTDALLRELIGRIDKQNEMKSQQMAAQNRRAAPPLSAPIPQNNGGRRQ